VANLAENPDAGVTLVACGERRAWDDNEEGGIRFALEDWIGVGAIAVHLDLSRSPETQAAVDAFRGAAGNLLETLRQCGSGIELEAKGHADDIAIAADVDRWAIAPRLNADGWFVDDRKAPTTT
jgi:2-phosphosulfolactate phosphatase